MRVKSGNTRYSRLITFGEKTEESKQAKIEALRTHYGAGKSITRPIYYKSTAPLRVVLKAKVGYSKKYVKRMENENVFLPEYFILFDSSAPEMAVTPGNTIAFLRNFMDNLKDRIDTAIENESDNKYDIPETAKEHPRLKEIEVIFVHQKDK